MQNRAAGVFRLQIVLEVEDVEHVIREVDRQMAGIGVERLCASSNGRLIGAENARKSLLIDFRQPIARAFRGRSLEVIEVAGLLLKLLKTVAHVVEDTAGEGPAFRCPMLQPSRLRQPSFIPTSPIVAKWLCQWLPNRWRTCRK